MKSQLVGRLALQLAVVQLDKLCRLPRSKADEGHTISPVDPLDLLFGIFLDDVEHFPVRIKSHQARSRRLAVDNATLFS